MLEHEKNTGRALPAPTEKNTANTANTAMRKKKSLGSQQQHWQQDAMSE